MTSRALPLIGQTLNGRYELRAPLGQGGFADVYRAWDRLDDREVAFKVLRVPGHLSANAQTEFVQKFQDEAKVTRKAFQGHAHVRQVFDMGTTPVDGVPHPWMAMELLEGETLADSLKRRRGAPPKPIAEVLAFVRPIFEVVAFAHTRGVVHRDLKPANVFLAQVPFSGSPVIKVLDFGIAKVLEGDELASGNTMTQSALAMFSPQYGAPEQFAGKKTGKYTDVFALGLLLTELLTDKAPLSESGDRTECMLAALDKRERPTPKLRGAVLPDPLERVIERAVALREADRFADAAELLRALDETAAGASTATVPTAAAPERAPAPTTTFESQIAAANQPLASTSFAERVEEFRPSAPAKSEPRQQTVAQTPRSHVGASLADVVPVGGLPFAPAPEVVAAVDASPYRGGPAFAPPPSRRRFSFVLAGLGLLAAGTAAIALSATRAPVTVLADEAGSASLAQIPVSAADPIRGGQDALVTIVEFADFQCPFCGKVEATLRELRDSYKGDVRVVWKDNPLPFHPFARPAAIAGQLLFASKGNDAFWRFHDAVFDGQKTLSLDTILAFARAAGADDVVASQIKTAIASPDGGPVGGDAGPLKITDDAALANRVNCSGTPCFQINGVRISGALPIEEFKKTIDAELEKARAKVDGGTARRDLYAAMVAANFDPDAGLANQGNATEDTTTVWNVPLGSSPGEWGTQPLVTIVEFSDFQCPFCKRVEPTLNDIHKAYGDQVRLVWKNEPLVFHNRAEPAAEVAMEALKDKGNDGFWRAHDALFDSQPKLEDADLEAVAKSVGVSVPKARLAINGHLFKSQIDADAALASDLQATGTPQFFINGRRLVGAQPFDKFKTIIDEEIPKAKAAIAAGTSPDGVYAALTSAGKAPSEFEEKTVAASSHAPFLGNPNARVVLQIFSDFQCPFCSRSVDTIKQVTSTYGDRVRIEWRNLPLPFHQNAALAAEAAMEAFAQKGNDGFWRMHDKLFQNQQHLERADLEGYAKELGLDVAKFSAALDSHSHKAVVDADAKVANDAGIGGTPGFLVNHLFISGAQPFEKFQHAIEKALASR